ncbi:uncharacterized protein EDB91DRAFT_1100625 [Suillus paluster]|uniref:uncharacterized protein n=1 Tax=Suillus paluster TaxID=48578 RepID=UPI001B85E8C8|nr:uncharacterized protein EDB91DRAFT_1100625 [Suillus paluster]KAG1753919.1 hypothetical protein EDB91DRAFT_1100625 [Suillus paluster]
MNLARHSITATNPIQIFDTRFEADCQIFTTTTPAGFAVYQTRPLKLIRKREFNGGTLAAVVPCHTSSLLFLLGGGRSPLYPPNKVVVWDDVAGEEVAELEFRERVRGLACRRGWLAVSFRRRVVVFEVGETIVRRHEFDTCDNPRGLLAIATGAYATLLAFPGRQIGHVQLVHLSPCIPPTPVGPPSSIPPARPPPPPSKHPVSIIAAHDSTLNTITVPQSGKLLRVFRRGSDKAEIYGVAFRPDEKEVCVWSDKGTVHVFSLITSGPSNRQSSLSPLASLIPYFDSEWSYAQYRIPAQASHISISSSSSTRSPTADVTDEEKCMVGWIQTPSDRSEPGRDPSMEYQLIALTYSGGWYRLSLPQGVSNSSSLSAAGTPLSSSPPRVSSQPRPRTSSVSSTTSRTEKGKERERDRDRKDNRELVLQEYRKYGRWDGWG